MKHDRTARTLLSVTALAWSIPFAQAGSSSPSAQAGATRAAPQNAEFRKLDRNGDGYLAFSEVRHLEGYDKAFSEADRNRDGKLDATESITAQQLYERAQAARYAEDTWITTKVKVALLREKDLDSNAVSVETVDQQVLLSGFVDDATQKRKALLVASRVEGVKDVKDGLQVR